MYFQGFILALVMSESLALWTSGRISFCFLVQWLEARNQKSTFSVHRGVWLSKQISTPWERTLAITCCTCLLFINSLQEYLPQKALPCPCRESCPGASSSAWCLSVRQSHSWALRIESCCQTNLGAGNQLPGRFTKYFESQLKKQSFCHFWRPGEEL